MNRKKKLKLCLGGILLLLAVLLGYKVYLLVYEADYQALNNDNIVQIEKRLHGKDTYTFAVVGNVRNSMRLFERRIAPLIKGSGADFMISAGNAVYDGAEGKYRLLHRGFKKLGVPYVLTTGHNEVEDFGAGKFYHHFGPYFFSFRLENASFIFLDSSGQTSWEWQIRWLRQELAGAASLPYRFVFLNDSPLSLPGFDPDDTHYVLDENLRSNLQRLFSEYQVTTVFSAGYPTYHETVADGVRYVVSGGGGGLLLRQEEHYQFAKVQVGAAQVACENVTFPHRPGIFRERLETLKLFLHSTFYMSLWNALLILGMIGLVALKIYSMIIRQEHLYRDFSVDEGVLLRSPLRVAMFTNTYLPFVGGVSLSINRLRRGLAQTGATVKIFAPTFPKLRTDPDDDGVFRCPSLFNTRENSFPVANIFSRTVGAAFKAYDFDVVHVHHPFWLGTKGMRLARKRGLPVVFTYHTRLERYMHYVPLPGSFVRTLIVHFLIKHFANKCDAIITPTASTEEYLRRLGVSALIETIPTGISLEDYKCWSPQQIQELRSQYAAPGERLLISVSRMAKEKNLDFLLAGLRKAMDRTHVPFKCILVGDGPEKERLEAEVTQRGMADRVVFSGNLDPHEVVRCCLAADIFVFASTSETQGIVLLEAMAGGCPVVAVRASGVYDMVNDGYNGFTVAESTDEWAEAVASLLEDNQRLSSMSENCRAFAESYSVEIMTEKVSRLYRRVVGLGYHVGTTS